jgi:hypothetical protein
MIGGAPGYGSHIEPGRKLRQTALALVFAVATLGCGEDATEEALVSYTFFEQPGFQHELLVVEFLDRHHRARLTSRDFEVVGQTR